MRLTVAARLALIAAVGVGAVAAMAGVSWWGSQAQARTATAMVEISTGMSRQWNADMMHDGIRGDVLGSLDALTRERRVEYEVPNVSVKASDMLEHLDAAAAAAPPELRARFADVRPVATIYGTTATDVVAVAATDKARSRAQIPAFLELFEQLETDLGELDAAMLDAVHAQEREGAATAATVSRLTWLVGLLALVGFAATSWFVGRGMVRPLRGMVQALDRVAEGDLGVRIAEPGDDEFGQMSRALNTALSAIGATVSEAGRAARALSGECTGLTTVSADLGETAGRTASQASQVAASAREVSTHVDAMSTATGQMDVAIGEIAGQAAIAAEVASEATRSASQTRVTVAQLTQASEEIGEIVKAITTIAEQTNLLALNATIEAARAGEAGKGFAVVATEVKELAQETGRATTDITAKIATIQAITGEASSSIEGIVAVIDRINENASMIAAAVEEQSVTTAEINRSVGEVSRGAERIADTVAGIAGSIEATSASADATQASAVTLSAVATQVATQIGHFTV